MTSLSDLQIYMAMKMGQRFLQNNEPNVSPHKQIIKDDDVKECISIE